MGQRKEVFLCFSFEDEGHRKEKDLHIDSRVEHKTRSLVRSKGEARH
jgi:hypothetical protein